MLPRKNKIAPFFICLIVCAAAFWTNAAFAGSSESQDAKFIPILHNGRVKAFDSFCRQTVETITGKERWDKKDAVTVILGSLTLDEKISDIPWIHIGNRDLLAAFALSDERNHFSYNEIIPSLDKIEALLKSASEKRELDKTASPLEKEAEALYGRLIAVKDLRIGSSLQVIPPADEKKGHWISAYETTDPHGAEFQSLVKLFSNTQFPEFHSRVAQWTAWVHKTTNNVHRRTIELEVFYSDLRPFQWAWIAYLAASILLSLSKKKPSFKIAGVVLATAAMAFHTLGLALRVLVLQRPPVSNMYESMVYMNWAVMVFAMLFAIGTRNLVYLSAGSAVSALVMIYGNLLPIDSNLEVLVPVLRSNYWLTIHVMTIVSSYGAFGLAMALGHRHLVLELFGKLSKAAQENSADLIYRVIQLGILLLGIGTVLGGVWANESWGRFWGWDPKETWALITFLAYLVVVHFKYSKKINAHWLAISSVLGFLFVLMTWYGVNFVLGRGLHSYGFGSGGMAWIIYYLAAEILFLAFVVSKGSRTSKA